MFIVFEGIDGSGKTKQIELLEKALKEQGINVHVTAEPTETALGGLIREVLAGKREMLDSELAVLFTADRINHIHNEVDGIGCLLDEGYTVICSRYYYSTVVYQGMALEDQWIKDMNINCEDIIKPDLVIYLDVTAEEAASRMRNREQLEKYEQYLHELEVARDRYLDIMFEADEAVIIDGMQDIDEVSKEVLHIVKSRMTEEDTKEEEVRGKSFLLDANGDVQLNFETFIGAYGKVMFTEFSNEFSAYDISGHLTIKIFQIEYKYCIADIKVGEGRTVEVRIDNRIYRFDTNEPRLLEVLAG